MRGPDIQNTKTTDERPTAHRGRQQGDTQSQTGGGMQGVMHHPQQRPAPMGTGETCELAQHGRPILVQHARTGDVERQHHTLF